MLSHPYHGAENKTESSEEETKQGRQEF